VAKHVTVRFGGGDAPVSPWRVTGYAEVPLAVVPTNVIAVADRVIASAQIPVPDQPNDDTAYQEGGIAGKASVYEATPVTTPGQEWAQRTAQWFTADSYWRTPLPDNAPVHANSATILHYIAVDGPNYEGSSADNTYLNLTNTTWACPVYWAKPGDPEYHVPWTGYPANRPPEHDTVRIPYGAVPTSNSDSQFVLFDVERGYVSTFQAATYDAGNDTWTTSGGSIAYLASNGLERRVTAAPWHEGSDDDRNRGSQRGNHGAAFYVGWEMLKNAAANGGDCGHIHKIALGSFFREDYIAPTVGSDGKMPLSSPWYDEAPKNGTRMRIKPSVVLTGKGLSNSALALARTLQKYGVYLGDSSGSTTNLKMENLSTRDDVVAAVNATWATVGIASDTLSIFPFTRDWEVISETYWP